MLVVVSDLHLTDGTLGETVSPGAFALFAQRLSELAVAASWRADGRYRPIESMDVLLLGDVFDVIRSARWTPGGVRPWDDPRTPEFADQIEGITEAILWHNRNALAVLHGLAAEDGLRLPPGLQTGRPATDAPGQPIPVRIHYMVGNHDWYYHLRGPRYDTVREAIIRQVGLLGRPSRPFAHDIVESDELVQVMRRHRIAARHGDRFDPLNYEGDRDASSLGDAIVIELINRFVSEVQAEMFNDLPAATLHGLREVDNVRPVLLVPVWLDGLLERTCVLPAMRRQVKTIWDHIADEFLEMDFVRNRDGWSPLDVVDGLARALKFSKRLSIGWASSIAAWMNKVRGAASDSYYPHALMEPDFRNRRAKHIVYGHTHAAESIPLDASHTEGYVLNQMYFNAGTWRRLHRQTQMASAEQEFIASDVMSYLVFFQGDERGGRPYETWSGSLGCQPAETTIYRIDPGRSVPTHAPSQSISAPDLHQRGPHFTPPSVKPLRSPAHRL